MTGMCTCGHTADRHVNGTICMTDCPCVLFDAGGAFETASRRYWGDAMHEELQAHQRCLRDHTEEQLAWQTARLQADVQVREALAGAINATVLVGVVLAGWWGLAALIGWLS